LKRQSFDFIVNCLASSFFTVKQVRQRLYQIVGLDIKTKDIKNKVFFFSKHIKIGKGSIVNSFTKMYSARGGEIIIGENCGIGMNCLLIAHTHKMGSQEQRVGKDEFRPIVIKNGCWLGGNVTVLPGVTIGEGCVIASGSVVIKDCKPNSLYAGNPAVWKKDLFIEGK
jgi:maltose O-acetyltransferase